MTVISGYSSRMNFIIARTGSGSLVICSGKAIMSKVTVTPMTLSVLVSRALWNVCDACQAKLQGLSPSGAMMTPHNTARRTGSTSSGAGPSSVHQTST